MFKQSLFRERALMRNAQPEPLDDLLRVTAPHEWLLVAGLACLLLVAVAWSVFGSVERTLSSGGALVRPGARYTLVSVVSGTVSEVLADVGEVVAVGQPLARLKLPELGWRLQVVRARVALLEAQAARTGPPAEGWVRAELASARAEWITLASLEAAGEVIVSSQAGELTARGLVKGQAVTAGAAVAEVRTGTSRPPEAVMFFSTEHGQRIETGMAARVAVATHLGSRIFPAEVTDISPWPTDPPPWLSRFGLASTAAAHAAGRLVRLTVAGSKDLQAPDGAPCRIDIILTQHSPLGLLVSAMGQSG